MGEKECTTARRERYTHQGIRMNVKLRRRWSRGAGLLFVLFAAATGCAGDESPTPNVDAAPSPPGFDWRLPQGFPEPWVPDDNPMSPAKVELGRHLFYDVRLSGNLTQSCASCHRQELAFTDGTARSTGSTGMVHPRSSMSLVNVAYAASLTWANPLLETLEEQVLIPMFAENPVELGLQGRSEELFERLRSEPYYVAAFAESFPEAQGAISLVTIARALAAFQRSIISANSPYDRHLAGDANALNESAKRGLELFFSETGECHHCHASFLLNNATYFKGKAIRRTTFHNTGLYNLSNSGAYPTSSQGLIEISQRPEDMGKFKAPSLRNVGVTAPYMHDGSVATLRDAVLHYSVGGRTISAGPNAGVGKDNPFKDGLIFPLGFSAAQVQDLVAFLESLTDTEVTRDPRFSNPW